MKLTRTEENKLIERTCKRDAHMDTLQWAGIRLSLNDTPELEHGSALWYALQKYHNHKEFCDKHTHYYDFANSICIEKEK